MTEKLDYDLTCWYINLRRVTELVGNLGLSKYLDTVKSIAVWAICMLVCLSYQQQKTQLSNG